MSGSQQLLLGGAAAAAPAVDPFFYSVTSLLHGDGTNGAQNNTFLDSSTNNFTITRNGNTTQGSFSPFSQTGWGNYFDGSGDSLTATNNAAYDFGSGAFTIEAWAFPTTASQLAFAARGQSTGFEGWIISTTNFLATTNGSSWDITITFTTALTANAWNHVAIVRNGNVYTAYLNGVANGTTTVSGSIVAGTAVAVIGQRNGQTDYSGYISNLRIVKGTAVYTANFTPSTTPLTAITNTSLLTCQANRFLDASSNAFAITANGNVSVQPFSPFNPTTAYSTSAVGGSGYFDGSGDYITVPDNAAFTVGSGNWTLEAWVYPLASPNQPIIIGQWSGGTDGSIVMLLSNDSNRYLRGAVYSGGFVDRISTASLQLNAWNHCAFVREGTALNLYLNGARVDNYSFGSGSIPDSSLVYSIGASSSGSQPLNAFVANARLVVGTAVYTGTTYTVPTAPLTAITNTQLLTNFTNAGIFDNAAVADYETVGNAQISTSVKKYGTGSMAFDGTGDYLTPPAGQNFVFGSGDFTIECWVYPTAFSAYRAIIDTRAATTNNTGLLLCLDNASTGAWAFFKGSTKVITATVNLSLNAWQYVAVTRVAGKITLYLNGTSVGSATDSQSFTDTVCRIGSTLDNIAWSGYIDDLRVSKGIGRYPYNFTPPTAEFPNIGGTVTLTADPYFDYTTLLLPGNGTNGAQNNTFLDSSTNAFSITRNGNTTQGTFSPFSQTGWGNYFDGSGDYLETPSNAAFTLGSSGDFTVECWVYATATPGNYAAFMTTWSDANTGYSNRWFLGVHDSKIKWFNDAGGSAIADSSNIQLNTWLHVAAVRSGSTITLYINGTAIGTQTTSQSYTTQGTVKLGYSGTGGNYFYGYISNARVVKGTAVYTSNFTVPTTPLTAITNTSLLTCQANRFLDASSNAFAITRNGDVSVQPFSPFKPTTAYSTSTVGGSGYFDGSGDYLVTPSNANLSSTLLGSDFTIEGWLYLTSYPSGGAPIWTNSVSNSDGFSSAYVTSTGTIGTGKVGTNEFATTATVVLNAWNHFATVRSGATVYTYLNGVQAASGAASTYLNTSATKPIQIAQSNQTSPANLTGYISGYRITTAAQYTGSTYTIPTAPPTAISGTNLLLNFTNAGIYDATSKNDLETVGNAQISTTQSKFGGSSMYFDGTGDWLRAPASPNLDMGTGDLTIEGWFYLTATVAVDYRMIVSDATNGNNYVCIRGGGTGGQLEVNVNGTSFRLNLNNTVTINTWFHLAVVRYNGTWNGFVNGASLGTSAAAAAFNLGNGGTFVGRFGGATAYEWPGYIDDLRITKGIARYTSNFTPPTTAFLTL